MRILFPPASLLVVGAVLSSVAAAEPSSDGFKLRLLTEDPLAVCLDGSPSGFYLRKGTVQSWVVELEGGGWCVDEADCLSRASTDIGSSKNWLAQGCPSMDGGSDGMLSDDCAVSPLCNWTAVHANYCDGASFAGFRSEPVMVNGTQIFFRGRQILDATIDALLGLGMSEAKEVVLKGCSAGGLATILHMDYFRARVLAANPAARVTAMPDAGFFLDHNNTEGKPSYTPHYKYIAAMQNTTAYPANGAVNDACVSHYGPLGESWRCFMAQYTLPFLTTPYFMTQDLVDSWQLPEIYQLPCKDVSRFTPSCLASMSRYRRDMLAALAPLVASTATNGGFITACVEHCHQNAKFAFTEARVEGQTLAETWGKWYRDGGGGGGGGGGNGTKTFVVAGEYEASNPDCGWKAKADE
jgi:hypothetical protein